jgi:hypothetical protein
LFIVLAARVEVSSLTTYFGGAAVLLAALVLVARPLSVVVSTAGSSLSWKEKTFMALLAPRGIVAASVAAVFALKLEMLGLASAEAMVPVSFLIVSGTVLLYGIGAPIVARRLGVAESRPQGVLIVGAEEWVLEIALALRDQGVKVLVVDSNWSRLSAARMQGLPAVYASAVSRYALDEIDLGGIGRLVAMTPADEFNSLVVRHFVSVFGRSEVYQLAPNTEGSSRGQIASALVGRVIVGQQWPFARFSRVFAKGATTKTTCLTEAFDVQAFREYYGDAATPLFVVDPSGRLQVVADDAQIRARPGQSIVSVIDPDVQIPGLLAVSEKVETVDDCAVD